MTNANRIGLLGGSFNPAHRAHLRISHAALGRLRLDEVWWLVSPQNPLKKADDMAPLAERLAGAARLADDPRIRVSNLESEFGTTYTVDTLVALKARFPDQRFVWIMGADVFLELPRWKDWTRFMRSVPVAVFPRPTYSRRALSGQVARRFARNRMPEVRAGSLASRRAPAWVFFNSRPDPVSATRFRAALAGGAKTRGQE